MSRLSYRPRVLASREALAISKRLSPDTAGAYERAEASLRNLFQRGSLTSPGRPLASPAQVPGHPGLKVHWATCPACPVLVLARDWETVRYCPAHTPAGPRDFPHRDRVTACGQETLFPDAPPLTCLQGGSPAPASR